MFLHFLIFYWIKVVLKRFRFNTKHWICIKKTHFFNFFQLFWHTCWILKTLGGFSVAHKSPQLTKSHLKIALERSHKLSVWWAGMPRISKPDSHIKMHLSTKSHLLQHSIDPTDSSFAELECRNKRWWLLSKLLSYEILSCRANLQIFVKAKTL